MMQAPVSRCLPKEAGYFCAGFGSEGRCEPTEAPAEGQENLLDVDVRLASGEVLVILHLEIAMVAVVVEVSEPICAAHRDIVGPLVFGTEAHGRAIGVELVAYLGKRL